MPVYIDLPKLYPPAKMKDRQKPVGQSLVPDVGGYRGRVA